jgi:T5SS/PEP-CTERM-associated repeat protein
MRSVDTIRVPVSRQGSVASRALNGVVIASCSSLSRLLAVGALTCAAAAPRPAEASISVELKPQFNLTAIFGGVRSVSGTIDDDLGNQLDFDAVQEIGDLRAVAGQTTSWAATPATFELTSAGRVRLPSTEGRSGDVESVLEFAFCTTTAANFRLDLGLSVSPLGHPASQMFASYNTNSAAEVKLGQNLVASRSGPAEVAVNDLRGELAAGSCHSVQLRLKITASNAPEAIGDWAFNLDIGGDDDSDSEVRWINPAGGSFDVAENWSPERVPGSDDVAVFDLSLPALTAAQRLRTPASPLTTPVEPCYSVATSFAATRRMLVRNCVVGMTGGSTAVTSLTAEPEEPSLGVGEGGTLQITSGTLSSLHTIIGDSGLTTDEPSTVNVFNEGTQWTEQGRLTVAEQSPGRLFVANRAFVQANETVIGSFDVAEAIVGGEAFMAMGDLIVGSSEIGEGSVIVEERGSIESFTATLGRRKGGKGSVTLSGSASGPSLWTCQGRLVVGSEGEGTLTIEGGSKVDAHGDVIVGALADGTGRVIVTGEDADGSPSSLLLANTRELVVGEFILEELRGKATLAVVDGGVVAGPLVETEPGKKEFTPFSGLRIGKVASDHGEVAVRGRGESGPSRLFVEEISVFEGDLFIESGGFVRTARLEVGGSTGRVRIAKSEGGEALDVTTDVTIAAGTVSVAESAMVVGRDFFVGRFENDDSSFLAVIGDAPNSLARVTVGGQMQVGNFERRANAVVLMGGGAILQIGDALFVDKGSRFIGRGTVVVPAAVIDGTVSSRVTVISASELRRDGAPSADATIDSTLEFDGNVELGSTAVVALFVEGDGQFGPLVVTGDLTLDGTLEVLVAEGYLPNAGDALGVIEVGGALTGNFGELRVRGVGEGFEFSFDPETGAVTAENDATPCEAGDLDGDGVLDCPAVQSCCGDPNGDAKVTAQDALAVLLGAVGQQACDTCCCDVDSSGGVTATDALRVLRAAVGEPIPLQCPGCN